MIRLVSSFRYCYLENFQDNPLNFFYIFDTRLCITIVNCSYSGEKYPSQVRGVHGYVVTSLTLSSPRVQANDYYRLSKRLLQRNNGAVPRALRARISHDHSKLKTRLSPARSLSQTNDASLAAAGRFQSRRRRRRRRHEARNVVDSQSTDR